MISKIPLALRELNQWILWREEKRNPTDEKSTKVPYQATRGTKAKPNDPETWSDFETARTNYLCGDWSGLGFVFSESDPFCGIDLDGCRNPETGKVEDWARQIVIELDSYAEVSPSQTGIKIFIRGKSPFDTGKKVDLDHRKVCSKQPGLEVYDRKRYFAVTGQRLAGVPHEPQERQEQLSRHCARWFEQRAPQATLGGNTDVSERASRYLSKMPPAISGQSGHNTAFRTACVLVKGFGLSVGEAYPLFAEWNQSCEPPWSEHELRHKLDDASKASGETGYLRDVPMARWASVSVPEYKQPDPLPERVTLASAAQNYLLKLGDGPEKLISLGIRDLDAAIGGGVSEGELIVVGARPNHGKSAIGLQMCHAACEQGLPSLILSEEMSALALGKRAILFSSDVAQEHWHHRKEQVANDLDQHFRTKAPCYVSESAGTAKRAAELITKAHREDGVKFAVVDYAQLLQGDGGSRYEQVTNTSIVFRRLAGELQITLIVLAQLNREIEKREKWVPKMGDLKDSGQLEQDADIVMFLFWPHRLDPSRDPHEYLMFIGKNRNRELVSPTVKCTFKPSRQMVVDSDSGQVDESRYWDDGDSDF